MSFSICVYCGSRAGGSQLYAEAALELGAAVARRGWRLVYGGGSTGLMGIAADAALAGGSQVIGVIPLALSERELAHPGLTQLQIVKDMHERKLRMATQADAFITLPGGIGTLEELFETWTWRQLGYHNKPIGLLEVDGYFSDLLRFLDRAQSDDFLWPQVKALLHVGTNVERLLDELHAQAISTPQASDLSQA